MTDSRNNTTSTDAAKTLRILTFGNSLTEGYTNFGLTFHPYAHALRTKLSEHFPAHNFTIDVNGQSGDCVLESLNGNFRHRLATSLSKASREGKPYDWVIMLGGTNDLAYLLHDPLASEKIFSGLKLCYEDVLVHSAETSLLCLTIPERAADLLQNSTSAKLRGARLKVNEMIESWCEEAQMEGRRAFVFDFAAEVPFPDEGESGSYGPWWSEDGLHMTREGYDYVGTLLAEFLRVEIGKREGAVEEASL